MSDQILDEELFENNQPFDEETVLQINRIKGNLNEDTKNVRHARTALIVLIVFTVLGIIIGAVSHESISDVLIEGLITIIIYTACAIGVLYNPRAALITGLSVYILLWMLYVLVDPAYLIKGLIFKGVIIYFLAKGINVAFNMKKATDRLFQLGASLDEIERAKSLEPLPRTLNNPKSKSD